MLSKRVFKNVFKTCKSDSKYPNKGHITFPCPCLCNAELKLLE